MTLLDDAPVNGSAGAAPLDTSTSFAAEWATWHEAHERRRADRHGFLAISSINWLTSVPTRFVDAPGEWSTSDESGPVVDLAPGESLVVDGDTVTGRHAFGPLAERGGITAFAGDGDAQAAIEIARRGGNDVVRPRHPGTRTLVDYTGTPAYEPSEAWAVAGRFVPFDEPRPTTVGSVAEGLQHVYDAPGVIEFEIDGEKHRLTAFNGFTPGSLNVLFTDATSGVTTYAANRSLSVAAPTADGAVVIDFTRAVNLPCAYTAFATCPLPPAENRLPIAVEAGEKAPTSPAEGGPVAPGAAAARADAAAADESAAAAKGAVR